MSKQEICVEDLRLGMYVVELDRPWLGTRFPFQGFPLTSAGHLEQLKSCCKVVYVDPERESWAPPPRAGAALRGTRAYPEIHTIDQEMPLAREIHQTCEDALRQLQDTLREHRAIRPETLKGAVASMTASIQRNPQAMLLLNTLRGRASYELARAMDTSILMITFGRFLRYPTERLEVLGLAGMLLDVGMSRLPDGLSMQDTAAHDPDDARVQAHVMHSVALVRSAQGLPAGVAEVVALHHERPDGTGYPSGRTGEAISIDGAVAAVVDGFVALTSARRGSAPHSPSNALGHLHRLRGTHYHEALVEQFIQCIGIYPVGSAVELNSGEVAIVVAQNLVRRLQPRVMVVADAAGTLTRPLKMLDLIKRPRTAGGEPYRIRRALAKDELPLEAGEFFV